MVVAGAGIFTIWLHRSLYRSIHKSIKPPPPKICGSPDGPIITASRIKLKDGRHIAYKETGVIPREIAQYKVIFVHGFNGSRLKVPDFPQVCVCSRHSVYMVDFIAGRYLIVAFFFCIL